MPFQSASKNLSRIFEAFAFHSGAGMKSGTVGIERKTPHHPRTRELISALIDEDFQKRTGMGIEAHEDPF